MTDSDAIERFTKLYDDYHRRAYAYAVSRAGRQLAGEVVSEVFLVAWRRLADVPDDPLAWLLIVARNVMGGEFRASARRQSLAAELSSWVCGTVPDVAEQVSERQGVLNVVGGDHVVRTATEWVYRQQPESPNTAIASSTEMTEVRYGNRTWSKQVVNATFGQDPTFDPAGMRELVADGVWRVAGKTRINGREVITLTRHWSSAGTTDTQTLFADARSYLPVRLVERDPGGGQQVDFGYLPPTAANLAKLTVTIPPGFTRASQP